MIMSRVVSGPSVVIDRLRAPLPLGVLLFNVSGPYALGAGHMANLRGPYGESSPYPPTLIEDLH
jgi:hypothetical protein